MEKKERRKLKICWKRQDGQFDQVQGYARSSFFETAHENALFRYCEKNGLYLESLEANGKKKWRIYGDYAKLKDLSIVDLIDEGLRMFLPENEKGFIKSFRRDSSGTSRYVFVASYDELVAWRKNEEFEGFSDTILYKRVLNGERAA